MFVIIAGVCCLILGLWLGYAIGSTPLCDEYGRPYVQLHPDDYAQLRAPVAADQAVSLEDILILTGSEGFLG